MLHTGIPAYANRKGLLVRLVVSLPPFFTTSDDVLCSNRKGLLVRLVVSLPLFFTTSDDVLCSKFGEV